MRLKYFCSLTFSTAVPLKISCGWFGLTLNFLMEKVERIQYQAALAVTGTWKGSNRSKLYEELGWETLSYRRRSQRVLQVHKIYNNKTPSYLKDKLPIHYHYHLARNAIDTFQELRCRTNRYMKRFFPDAISSWNILISHFINMPIFSELKTHITSLFRPKIKSIFGIHDPLGIHYLFQLRVSLSPLRTHKKDHNF